MGLRARCGPPLETSLLLYVPRNIQYLTPWTLLENPESHQLLLYVPAETIIFVFPSIRYIREHIQLLKLLKNDKGLPQN